MSAQSSGRWVTQQEAAQELGISTEAVRMRVRRGSLDSSKDDQGRVIVWVVVDRTETAHKTAQQPDESSRLVVEALEARIESLERSLEHERESGRRKDTIIMQMAQRIPELEAPSPPQNTSRAQTGETEDRETGQDAPHEPARSEAGVTPRSTLRERLRRFWSG